MERHEAYELLTNENIPLGHALKLLRKSIGKTQAEYATLCSVGLNALRDIEQGRGNPTLNTIGRLLRPFRLELCVKPSQDISSLSK
jgi:transcriptional regulator with XRE-family HTH domain